MTQSNAIRLFSLQLSFVKNGVNDQTCINLSYYNTKSFLNIIIERVEVDIYLTTAKKKIIQLSFLNNSFVLIYYLRGTDTEATTLTLFTKVLHANSRKMVSAFIFQLCLKRFWTLSDVRILLTFCTKLKTSSTISTIIIFVSERYMVFRKPKKLVSLINGFLFKWKREWYPFTTIVTIV